MIGPKCPEWASLILMGTSCVLQVLRQTLKDRADDIMVVSVLSKVLESPTLSVREALSICVFAMSLYGGELPYSTASMLRDSLSRKTITTVQGPDGRAKLEELGWLPRDLVNAMASAGSGTNQMVALEMELKDHLDDYVMRRLQDMAFERR